MPEYVVMFRVQNTKGISSIDFQGNPIEKTIARIDVNQDEKSVRITTNDISEGEVKALVSGLFTGAGNNIVVLNYGEAD